MIVIFMGTPEFAATSLKMLINNNINVKAVITQPDRPVGRKRIITPPSVKKLAQQYNLPVYQPEKVNDPSFVELLKTLKPDIIAVSAFGQILSKAILGIPSVGCINVHASLLPKYRGAAPVQWAIINGETKTGVTTMWMDEGLDTGDVFLQDSINIREEWTTIELFEELAHLGGNLLLKTFDYLKSGNIIRKPQDEQKSTYAPMLKKEDGKIDWTKSARDISNLIRGTYPWPGAFTIREGRKIKILKAMLYPNSKESAPGKFMGSIKNKGFLVGTGDNGAILIKELQESGGIRMEAIQYLIGHNIKEGDSLTDD